MKNCDLLSDKMVMICWLSLRTNIRLSSDINIEYTYTVIMLLSPTIPGGLTPGTYGGIARDLLTFVANFWPGTGALDRFCTSEARNTGEDPRDL